MRPRRVPTWVVATLAVAGVAVVAASVAGARRSASAPSDPVVDAPAPGPVEAAGAAPGTGDDRRGAAAAALDHLATLSSLVEADPTGREAALRSLAAPGAPTVVTRTLEGMAVLDQVVADARDALASARVLVTEVPVSYTVAAHDGTRARVEVWSVGVVLIEGRTDATEVWSTNTVELSWAGDRWRVWDWSRRPGPVPAPSTDSPTAPADVLAGVGTWDTVAYAPGR